MVKHDDDFPADVTVNQKIDGYSVELVFRSESAEGTFRDIKDQLQQAYAERIAVRPHKKKKN